MLKDRMPQHVADTEVFKTLLQAEQNELDRFSAKIKEMVDQFAVSTATEWLKGYEQDLGIKVNTSKSIDERRSVIISRLRGYGVCTIALIELVASSYNNGEVKVIEDNPNYTFTIKFIANEGIPQNLSDLKAAVEEIKPVHLKVEYDFAFMTFDRLDAKNITWDELDVLGLTWDDFEIGGW